MIYDTIKRLAREKGISINKLEKELNLSPASISKWNTSSPSVERIGEVAKYFDLSIDELIKLSKQEQQ